MEKDIEDMDYIERLTAMHKELDEKGLMASIEIETKYWFFN